MADKKTEITSSIIAAVKAAPGKIADDLVAHGIVEGGKKLIAETTEAKIKRRLKNVEKAGLVRTHVDHLFLTEEEWPLLERRLAQSAGRFSRQAVERIVMANIYEFVSHETEAKESVTNAHYPRIRTRLYSLETAAATDASWLRTVDRLSEGQGLISEAVHAVTHVFEEPPPAVVADNARRLGDLGRRLSASTPPPPTTRRGRLGRTLRSILWD
ncbi:MAG TPA: hypothetical protein VJJ02_02895 [Candidatus Paceibacterota bacterium]